MQELPIVAAHLAAELINPKMLEKVKGSPADAAAKIYFDCLDALKAEEAKRRPAGEPAPAVGPRSVGGSQIPDF